MNKALNTHCNISFPWQCKMKEQFQKNKKKGDMSTRR